MKRTLILAAISLFCAVSSFGQVGNVTFSKSPKTAESATEFKSGDFIFAHVKYSQPPSEMLTYNNRPVTFAAEYFVKGKSIEEEMFGFDAAKVKASKQNPLVFPIISDPAGDVPVFGKNLFATRLPAALAALPEGRHEIEYKVKSYNYKDGNEVMASGKFTLVIEAGANAWYKKNEKDSYDAMVKRGVTGVVVSERDAAMGVVGGTSVITLVNNCGRSVWLRKATGSDKREYRLAPGQTMKYDRDSGYLEEWNFKTLKWATVSRVWATDANGKANICQ